MPLAKLFRVLDTNNQAWFVPAPTFSAAVQFMHYWEGELDASDDEVVMSVEAVGDLIVGGTREESLSNYIIVQPPPPPVDWDDANEMALAIHTMLHHLPADETKNSKAFWDAVDRLRKAVDKYEEMPF